MTKTLATGCCVAGGGPAGMMLGYLLARAGVDVVVLEKHADFLRDFRGDTVHPSTMEIMWQLGLLEKFLSRPHDEITEIAGQVGKRLIRIGDFRAIPAHAKFIALMPQWDFLDFLCGEARAFPEFHLLVSAEAEGLIEEGGDVVGVRATTIEGSIEIRAPLSVAADGRSSALRAAAGLEVEDIGAPMDVLWMRLPRRPDDPDVPLGVVGPGQIFVQFARGDYYQCAFVVPKGALDAMRRRDIAELRAAIADVAPILTGRVIALATWDDVKLLTVRVDRLRRWWRRGLICIGDAAHAMSPVGGVGVNLAIQDAVATANILAGSLAKGHAPAARLRAVQRRRAWPTMVTQAIQVFIQRRVIAPTLGGASLREPPAILRLLDRMPILRRIPAQIVGMGVRPERVRTRDAHAGVAA